VSEASETLLSVVNGKLQDVYIYIFRHQNVAWTHNYVKWAELSPNHWFLGVM